MGTIFVVNRPERKDRRAKMAAQLPDAIFTSDMAVPDESHVTVVSWGDVLGWTGVMSRKSGRYGFRVRPIRAGEVDCSLRHAQVWEAAAQAKEPTYIFEDDAELPTDWQARADAAIAKLPPDWSILFLGGQGHGTPITEYKDGIIQPTWRYNTHAYVLSVAGAKELLAADITAHMMPVNEFMMSLYVKNHMPFFSRPFTAYALQPALVPVPPADDSDTRNSPTWQPS